MASAFNTKTILINLLKVYNQSGQEKYISTVIMRWLKKHNIDFNVDNVGNIYSFKHDNAPFLNAHLDSVQRDTDKLAGINLNMDEKLIIKSPGHIIGGDDLVGVYIILYLLANTELRFNWIFTVFEETGGIGSTHFLKVNSKLISDSSYGIVVDRKGNDDIICANNDYGTENFQNKLFKIGKDFKYSPATGTWSDANKWRDYVSCANLSCGYYEAHTTREYVNLADVFNTINYVKAILSSVKQKFKKAEIKRFPSWYGGYNEEDFYGHHDDCYYGNDDFYSGYPKMKNQKSHNERLVDEYEVFEEEDDEFPVTCKFCGVVENFQDYDNHIWINSLQAFVCEYCLIEIYDEIENKIPNNNFYNNCY